MQAFTYGGYQDRGEDIYGEGGQADDGKAQLVLSYANGYGYWSNRDGADRVDPADLVEERKEMYFRSPATVPRTSETHGGDDVGIWAIGKNSNLMRIFENYFLFTGPWAHLFSKTIEQNAIPHFMGYASCLGKGKKMCDS